MCTDGQPEMLEDATVDAGGGATTTMGSPHFDTVVVTRVPPEAVVVTFTGSVVPTDTVREFDSMGVDPVAAIVHLKRS
jgi:hypothetical protein